MTVLPDLTAAWADAVPARLSLPEYRQIELYTKRKVLPFADPPPPSEVPVARVAALAQCFMVLDAVLESREEAPGAEGRTTWRHYLDLPRATMLDKLIAETYRILRIVRAVAYHPHGHVEVRDGVVRLNGAINRVALSLEITEAGLMLLESAVVYYLRSLSQPYPDAYVAAMLGQYFFDIVAETKRFADEDRILYQFRHARPFGRHFRFDCDNPKAVERDGMLEIDIGANYRDAARFPIDFYVSVGNALHILPVEALPGGRIALTDLTAWRAKLPDGLTLPAAFRPRFGREVMVVGQPMT